MNQINLKKTAIWGLAWQMLERVGVNGMQFIIYIILARLLAPKDFGILALITAFISITSLLVDSGLGTALIQKKDVDEDDYSSVLYTSLFLACVFYLILFLMAPLIADIYREPIIIPVLRTYSIAIIFFAINGVQKSILLREMKFKRIFIINTIPVLASGAISILMAYLGYGVYSLVFNSVSAGFFSTVLFWFVLGWKFKRSYSIEKVKGLFSFSYKLLLANLLDPGYRGLYTLVIGKVFSNTVLGYYNYGRQIPNFIVSSINSATTSVMFPIYSHTQSDMNKLKSVVRQSISVSNFVIFPTMTGLAAVSEPLVKLVLTDKWLPSVPFLQLFCIVYGLYHLQSINFQAISAIGRSDVFLRYELLKKMIGVVLLVITIPFGIIALTIGQVVLAIISIIINFRPNKKWLNYTVSEQLSDFIPSLLLSLFMFSVVWAIRL